MLTHRHVNKTTRPFAKVHIVPRPSRWNVHRLWRRFLVEVGVGNLPSHNWSLIRPQLKDVLIRISPDVLHAHFGPMGALVVPVARELSIPLVVTFYGYDISRLPRNPFWQAKYHELWEAASAVTVLSKEMRLAALELGYSESKLHIIHLSRDLINLPYRSPTGGIKTFVSVGRLTEKKGHLDTIKAFQRVVQERDASIQLRIIGAGHLQGELSDYIVSAGMGDHITLTGALPNSKVTEELRAADAFMLCSKTAPNGDKEGTPTVLVEAQAIGLPCITTHHAGIPEMIPPENHTFLAEEGNVAEIADRIEKLLACSPEEVRAISKAGRKKVEEEFNLTHEVKKLRAVYRSVCDTEGIAAGIGASKRTETPQ